MQPETAVATRTQTLMDLSTTISNLWDCLESAETDEDRAAATKELERVVAIELATKADGIAWWDKRADQEIDLLKEMRDDIQQRIVAWQRRKDQVRDMTRYAMQRMGATQMRGKVHTISLRPPVESVEVTDQRIVPAEYCTVVPAQLKPDKAAIKRALKAGVEVPGAELRPGDPVLTIR